MTGTPFRTDGRIIEGFDWEVEEIGPVSIPKRREVSGGQRVIDIYEGERSVLKLKPDFEYTLRESWDVDKPPALCKITRVPLDFNMNTLNLESGEVRGADNLSQLPPSVIAGKLGGMLREPRVIEPFCQTLHTELMLRKRIAPDSAAIVFVGNDRPDEDEEENQHAHRVVEILGKVAPALKCMVATSASSNDSVKTLQQFQQGEGDVLVVKQMGCVGYDVPRAKVALDLSTVRTAQQCVQRIARIARVWQRSADPDDVQMTAVYITPDDALGAAIWQNFITDNHGETNLTNLEYVKTVQGSAGDGDEPPKDIYLVDSVVESESYSDTDMQVSPVETLSTVRNVMAIFSFLPRFLTHNDVEKKLPDLRAAMAGIEVNKPLPAPNVGSYVENANANQEADQVVLNRLAKEVTLKRLGRNYSPKRDGEAFRQTIKKVWIEHKKMCRILHKEPRDYTVEDADALKDSLLEDLQSYG